MSQSLSVILPVCNAEAKLAWVVLELLEVASELTPELEVMIVDDGSSDGTIEVAMEMKRQFPQVKVIRQSRSWGIDKAVRAGLWETQCDVVLVHNLNAPFSPGAIRELWNMRSQENMAFARWEPISDGVEAVVVHGRRSDSTRMIRQDSTKHVASSHIPSKSAPKTIPPEKAASTSDSSDTSADTVTRTDKGNEASPVTFHQHSNVEMQPDR